MARPSARANSRLVTGTGAVTFSGPVTCGCPQSIGSSRSNRCGESRTCIAVRIPSVRQRRNGTASSSRQRPAGSLEHDTGTKQHDARGRAFDALRLRFPLLAQVRKKIVAGRRRLGLRVASRCAVVADAAGADEDRRRGRRVGDGGDQASRRNDPAVAKESLSLRLSTAGRRCLRRRD